MKQVTTEERTEIKGVFCPLSGKQCQMDCKFMIDVEDGCKIERACKNMETVCESLEEICESIQNSQNQNITNQY